MPWQILLQLSLAHVPHFQRRIFAARDEEAGVGGEAGFVDRADVAAEGGYERAVLWGLRGLAAEVSGSVGVEGLG